METLLTASARKHVPTRDAIVVANFVGVTTGEAYGEKSLDEASAYGRLILGCEADDIDHRDQTSPLDLDEWRILHKGNDVGKDGCLVAFEREFFKMHGNARWVQLSPAVSGKMNARYRLEVDLTSAYWKGEKTVAAVHFAPDRFPALRRMAADRMGGASHVDVFGGDFNLHASAVRARYRGKVVRNAEVLNLVGKRGPGAIKFGTAKPLDLAHSDHPGLWVPFH